MNKFFKTLHELVVGIVILGSLVIGAYKFLLYELTK